MAVHGATPQMALGSLSSLWSLYLPPGSLRSRFAWVQSPRLLQESVFRDDGPGRPQAIDRGADDAARVARPFADRIQPHQTGRLARNPVAQDADRGAAAGFGADQRSFRDEVSPPASVHDRQAVMKGLDDKWWDQIGDARRDNPALVTARRQPRGGPVRKEVGDALNRAEIIPPARLERHPLVVPLQPD